MFQDIDSVAPEYRRLANIGIDDFCVFGWTHARKPVFSDGAGDVVAFFPWTPGGGTCNERTERRAWPWPLGNAPRIVLRFPDVILEDVTSSTTPCEVITE